MRMITLEATPESGHALYSALSPFHPEFDTDVVSVSVGSQKDRLEVLDTIQQHLVGGADSITSWVTTAAQTSTLPRSRGNGGSA